ncbi:putative hexosyltransferase [Flindersiella endophytica]
MQLVSSRPDLAQLRVLGASGSAVIAAVSVPQLVDQGSAGTPGPAVVCTYVGLALLVVAWWRLGNLVHARRGVAVDAAELRNILLWWAVPFLACPPLFSRDVYSYLTQGAMVNAGIGIYQHGPSALGGPIAAEVPEIWQHTAAPYGPVFVLYAAAVAGVAGTNLTIGVLGMRLVALLGVALLLWALPRLAERCGASPTGALWLGVLNPLVLLHCVAGAHNDAVMLGLLAAGLAIAAGSRSASPWHGSPRHAEAERWARLVCGATLIALAALVKVPAVLALGFLVPLWAARGLVGGRVRALAGLAVGAVAVGTAVLVTSFAGTGFGWTRVLGTPVSAQNWSVTSALGRITAVVTGTGEAMTWWRWAGLSTAVGLGLVLWIGRERIGPVRSLGLAFVAVVGLGPAFRPWYLLWGVIPLAAALVDERDERLRQWLAVACGALVLVVLPDGFALSYGAIGQAALGVCLALGALLAVGRLSAPQAGRPVPVFQR